MTSYEMRKEWFTEVLENYHTGCRLETAVY